LNALKRNTRRVENIKKAVLLVTSFKFIAN